MTQHTPGPWKNIWHGSEVYPFPLSVHTADGSSWIARDGTVSSKANAALIAAAPELLEVVRAMATFDGRNNNAHLKEMARAAIAKAEGTDRSDAEPDELAAHEAEALEALKSDEGTDQ